MICRYFTELALGDQSGTRAARDHESLGSEHQHLHHRLGAPKIDKSFVAGIIEDQDALAIVTSIVDLARAIGATTVAEGVETTQHAALLRTVGCATAQGWLRSPAVAPDHARSTGALCGSYDVGQPVGVQDSGPVPASATLSIRT